MVERQIDLPRGLVRVWQAVIIPAGALVLEQLWEKTLLTWREGPQMLGFTLTHVFSPLALIGMLSFWVLVVWLALVVCLLIWRRSLPGRPHGFMILLAAIVVVLAGIPYSFLAGIGGVHV